MIFKHSRAQEPFTDNTLLGGRVVVRQPTEGYRAAVDPVLLAAAVPAHGGQHVLDAGCGTGNMAKVLHQMGYSNLDGLDPSPGMLDEARRKNIYQNLHQLVLDAKVSLPDHSYDAVVAAGVETVRMVGAPAEVTVTAGVGHSASLLDATPEEWDRVVNVNTRGVWLAMRELARPMLAGGGGSIVATSSVSARLADRGMGIYCASKAALDMLIAVAAAEWCPTVRVNGVAPGVTDTRMLGGAPHDSAWLRGVAGRTPLRRLGTPEDIAESVRALHSSKWTTGEVLRSDGGLLGYSPISPGGEYPL